MQTTPNLISPREIQRSYRQIFDRVKARKKPVVVMKNNRPDVAIVPFEALSLLAEIDKKNYGFDQTILSSVLQDAAGMWQNRKEWQGQTSGRIVREMRKSRVRKLYDERR